MMTRQRLTIPLLTLCALVWATFSCGHRGRSDEAGTANWAPETVRRASIVFGGDVMAHMPQIMAAHRDSVYDFSESFKYIKPFLDTADIVIANLETTISQTGEYSGYPLFSSPPELIDALKESGFDILVLANNHICDKGKIGITSTIQTLENAGLRYTGAFADSTAYHALNPLRFDINGIRFALLNYTYGTNGNPIPRGTVVNMINTAKIATDIGRAKDSADIAIVFFHWGEEYMREPTESDKALAEWCRDKGADIIIGSHPHVIQRPEAKLDPCGITRSVTVYSLGNLISNQRQRYTDGGMLVRLDIELDNSPKPAINARYMLTWTYPHWQDGRKYYHILPSPVADTMLLNISGPSTQYGRFMADSRRLFGIVPGFDEIKSPSSVLISAEDVSDDNTSTDTTIVITTDTMTTALTDTTDRRATIKADTTADTAILQTGTIRNDSVRIKSDTVNIRATLDSTNPEKVAADSAQ